MKNNEPTWLGRLLAEHPEISLNDEGDRMRLEKLIAKKHGARVDRQATIDLAAAVLCARAAQFGDASEPTSNHADALMAAAVAYARAVRG